MCNLTKALILKIILLVHLHICLKISGLVLYYIIFHQAAKETDCRIATCDRSKNIFVLLESVKEHHVQFKVSVNEIKVYFILTLI